MLSDKTENKTFQQRLETDAGRVNELLLEFLDQRKGIEPQLKKAMRYVVEGRGKRLRAALVFWSCQAVGAEINPDAEAAAAAIEMVHSYSLVHDDLPAMDDDDLRRGRPTCHKAFDEPAAILAGDGLLTLAFEILAEKTSGADTGIKLVRELAHAAGPSGMVAGQMADLRAENAQGDLELVKFIHLNKTARMFCCAAVMGGVCGKADDSKLEALRQYGMKIGLGFQIADDILDVSASSEQLGKTAGKDKKQGKATYPALVGIERSRQIGLELADEAASIGEQFGQAGQMLVTLARLLPERTK